MKDILVENQFGHGAMGGTISTAVSRFLRSTLGQAGIPFDWKTGFRLQSKIGVIPKKNQGQSGSCGGQAGSYFIGTVSALTGTQYQEISAKSIYAPIAYPGGGAYLGDLETQLSTKGANSELLVSSYESGLPPGETFMEDLEFETTDTLKEAMSRAGWTAVNVPIDIESIAEAIRDHGAIIWKIEGQNNGTWLGSNPKPPVNNKNLWRHFMCSEGAFSNVTKTISMFQSWGDKVGDGGIQYFDEEYINSGYITDVVTFVKNKYLFTTNFGIYSLRFNDVIALQKILIAGKYVTFTTATGFFGALTKEGVKAYQRTNNLPITGYVGPLTRGKLNT